MLEIISKLSDLRRSPYYTDTLTLVISILKQYDDKEYIETEQQMKDRINTIIEAMYR